jgi:Tfp pilus assembly protein PilF
MSKKNISKSKFKQGMADYMGNDFGSSIHLFTEAIDADPQFKLAFQSRGAAYMRLGKTLEALADFNKVIEMDPDNARAYHLRGLVYEKNGDNQKALLDLNKSLELNPQYGAAYHSRANLHTKMGNMDMATEDIQMVTHLSEVNIETFANENNVWRSQHLRLETMLYDDPAMDR